MKKNANDIPGFGNIDDEDEAESNELPKIKSSKKGGGFQSMGLSFNLLKGVIRRGYKIPTPIQRKTIPLALEGRDIVAMARTGSGKTACFLIPMFEKLKHRIAKTGARALILSPTRELALQTLKFIREIGRFLDLQSSAILGGDSMDEQFSVLHKNPDVIVATPGRFLHVCVEMDLKLDSIEYVVFDEADRLFEMGLGEQLYEIMARIPESRQTLLFSATLPKVLVEFAKAGLSDPALIRLDVESKLPTELELFYLTMRQEEKLAALIVLVKLILKRDQQTIIFVATKHHVEYLHAVLERLGFPNSYIYSSLDPSARKINAAKFSLGKVKILVVTDIAARGIDIPQLDNVINFNFPGKAKLFVHRVGRCARAGRSGTAYSLITPDEYAHLLDLHLFLGKPLTICTSTSKEGNLGRLPQHLIEEQHSSLLTLHTSNKDLVNLKNVSEKGYLHYIRTRPAASPDSNSRVKTLQLLNCSVHPIFRKFGETIEKAEELLSKMKIYRPQGTIFEICGRNKSQEYVAMKEKRALHKQKIADHHIKSENSIENITTSSTTLEESNSREIDETFDKVILPKKRRIDNLYKKKVKKPRKDENYIPYVPADRHTEEGLAVNNFQNEAARAELDIIGDSEEVMYGQRKQKKWDRVKKKMVGVENKKTGKIKTESGVWIPATFKSGRYSQWKEKTKQAENEDQDEDNDTRGLDRRINTHWARHNEKLKEKQRKSEIKTTDEILKARRLASKKKRKNMSKKKKGKRKVK